MTIFRYNIALLLIAFLPNLAIAQTRSVTLEPISETGLDIVQVRNIYGKCGPAVVQVLGVRDDVDYFYTVDSNADVVVIGRGGRPELHLARYLSDHNGVACVGSRSSKKLLIWSDCAGTACGHGWSFTVVDPVRVRVVAGGASPCTAQCAAKVTGSRVPLQLSAN